MSSEWEPGTLFEVFGSESARRILALAVREPQTAQALAADLQVSEPTVYRRINVLQEYDLLRERTHVAEDGNQYRTYETTLERVCFTIDDDGQFAVDLRVARDTLDDGE